MSIKIVTDSSCDLPPALIHDYGITVLPLYINVGKHGYLDGVELSRQAFYENLPTYQPHPTTAAPSSERFRQSYQRLAEEGATEILSIHIAGSLSATINMARLGAEETNALPVTVFDSGQLSLGMGFLALRAAQAAAEGCSMAELVADLEAQCRRTHVFAALDTLEYLRRSGRVNSLVASFGSLLRIKPLLKMYNGEATSERVRTSQRAIKRLIALLHEQAPLEKLALLHSNAPDKAEALRRQVQELLPQGKVLSVNITPAIGCHIGPGAVGFACTTQSQQ